MFGSETWLIVNPQSSAVPPRPHCAKIAVRIMCGVIALMLVGTGGSLITRGVGSEGDTYTWIFPPVLLP